jgi:hypothetical protein
MTVSCLSPFRWAEFPRPSIFATDKAFTGNALNGKTQSQVSSETVTRLTEESGRSPGSISGLSDRGDALIEQSNYRRGRK